MTAATLLPSSSPLLCFRSQNHIDTQNASSYTSIMASPHQYQNKKILFLIPPSKSPLKFVTCQQPINLAYLAAAVIKEGFPAAIWDYSINEFSENNFIKNIAMSNPAAIGIHCKTLSIVAGNYLAGIVKKHFPHILTIVGGPHSSALPVETMEEFPDFDMVVIGEGELTIAQLCREILNAQDWDNVDGLAYRKEGRIICTGRRELVKNLDNIDYPARHLLPEGQYDNRHATRGISPSNHRTTEIFTSRGCPGKCIFCAANVSFGNCVRFRTADNVLGEVEECIARYKYNHIIIQDDTFTLNKNRVSNILAGFRKLGLKSWSCDSRVDTVSEELLREMAESGCKKISFGVESGSEKILKLIEKNISLEQVVQAVALARASKIDIVECTFIIGSHPDETHDDVQATWRLIKEIRPDIIAISVIVPYPGTEVYRLMEGRGLINAKKWNDFQIIGTTPAWRTTNFSSTELLKLQRELLNRYYFSPGYLIKSMGKFKDMGEIKYFFRTGLDYATFIIRNKVK
ncbi:MAG: radical SAM protein [Smithella sp.]|jgi:anaerobic magnesium-protoporphyrin IX monomethyl ester cyclase